ncbi:MAG TPA: invasin domain 3-containing protein [Gemmatimonadaceae bacterium]|nr:invasin domain 3-containing protein [Gemmatimonadaceae bacterium]
MSAHPSVAARAWRAVVANVTRRRLTTAGAGVAAAVLAVACSEGFVTGPLQPSVTISLRDWSDTLVLGDERAVGVVVRDHKGREVIGAKVRVSLAAAAVLGADAGTVGTGERVRFTPLRPGVADVTLSLDDARFDPTSTTVRGTVVTAGVRLLGARDTTMTAVGDTSLVLATALARGTAGATAPLVAKAGQGLTWTRSGSGALAIAGTGDSVRAVALAAGIDTLVATHAYCLRGARCADTLIVRVSQEALAFTMPTDTLWAWAFGDTVVSRVPIVDARGNAVSGVTITAAPIGAADSAIVGVGTAVGVPSFALGVVRQAGALRAASGAASGAAPAGVDSPPLVARANGTSHVRLRALAGDGRVLGASQIVVIVRQIAARVRVAPGEADVTPGDSVPVLLQARDARGSVIADATFAPTMSAGLYRGGRVLVAANAGAGTEFLRATVTGVAAPSSHARAPFTDPAPDSAKVVVRVPAPLAAGDTTSATGNLLTSTVLGADGRPRSGVWVRFVVPAGSLAGADSVLSDANGVVSARWTLPTLTGRYTATAFVIDAAARADSAGQIVLRHSATVVAGAPASLAIVVQSASTALLGSALAGPVVVQLRDAYGNPVKQAGIPVTVSAAGGAGFTLGGNLTVVTDSLGQATFGDLTGTGSAGVQTLSFAASAGGATLGASSSPITFTGASVTPPTLSLAASTIVASPTTLTADGTSATSLTITLRSSVGGAWTQSAGTLILATTAGTLLPVTDNGDGTYAAQLRAPTAIGAATVSGTIGGSPIGGTALVTFVAGAVSPSLTTISVATSTVVNGMSPVTVTLRDANGNPVAGAASGIALSTTLGTLGALVDNGDGTYTAILTAGGTAGTASVSATVGGQSVGATLPVSAGGPSLATTTIAASPTTVTVGSASGVTVQLRDAGGNALTVSGGTVALSTSAGSLGPVTDNGNGTYSAVLTAPTTPGAVSISGTLNGGAIAGTASVTVNVGAPSSTTSTLAVTTTSLYQGDVTTVTVVVRDAYANVITGAVASDVVLATTLGSLGTASCGSGICTAAYTASAAGAGSISAKIGGNNIGGSPASIAVTSGLGTTQAIPSRTLNAATSYPAFIPVTAGGGTTPYGFVLSGGTLPAGMSFDASTGTISGTASATLATTTFTVTVTDGASAVSSKTFDLTVNAALATTQAVPSTTLGVGASYPAFTPVTATGGSGTLAFALSGGTLPPGVSFDSATGQVSGTPASSLSRTSFTVTVTDSIGATSSKTFDLAIDGPPSAPTIAGITAGDGQLSVAFTAPASDGGSAITNYEYSTDGGSTWTTRAPASTASPIVIMGLVNGTTYQVKLRAVSSSGSGTPSLATAATPTTTAGAPAITGMTPGDGQLSVAFSAPASDGGSAIINYEYSTDGGTNWSTRSPAAVASPLAIAGLTNGTTYQVKLRAVTAAGAGAASAGSSGTPRTVPGAPTNLVASGGSANASLAWTAPASNGGSAITDYTVEYSANGGSSWSSFPHAASTTPAITVTGLTNGTSYTFRVSAVNAAGTGATSSTATATPGSPGAPTGLVLAFNQTSATTLDGLFSWTAPASAGATAIVDYVIEYRVSGAPGWTTFPHAASTATSATVPNLVPSTTYEVRVSAKNGTGTGAPSAIATATTVGPSSRLQCFQPGNSNSSANSISIAPCSGVVAGNVILIPVTIANASTTTPVTISQDANTSGFTALGTQLNGSNQTTIFYKLADATDVGRVTNYGFTWTGNVKNAITLVTYKTTDGNAPTYYSTSGTGVTATAPAVTVSDVSSYTLVYVYTMVGVALSSTTPTIGEWTVSNDLWKNTTAGANNALAAAITTEDVDKFASGTTLGRDATTASMTSSTKWNAAVLVLKAP